MNMARRRKRVSTTQRVAQYATLGLPAPLRYVFSTRLGSLFFVFVLPVLIMTGIFTIEWKDGWPQFRFHRDRAQQVREEIRQEIRDEFGDTPGIAFPSLTGEGQPTLPSQSAFPWQFPPRPQDPQQVLPRQPIFNSPGVTEIPPGSTPGNQATPSPRPFARTRGAFDAQR
jgi:hypothetical protein